MFFNPDDLKLISVYIKKESKADLVAVNATEDKQLKDIIICSLHHPADFEIL